MIMILFFSSMQCFPQDLSKEYDFLEDAILWLNSWPIQKKLGIEGFFRVTGESGYQCFNPFTTEARFHVLNAMAFST